MHRVFALTILAVLFLVALAMPTLAEPRPTEDDDESTAVVTSTQRDGVSGILIGILGGLSVAIGSGGGRSNGGPGPTPVPEPSVFLYATVAAAPFVLRWAARRSGGRQ